MINKNISYFLTTVLLLFLFSSIVLSTEQPEVKIKDTIYIGTSSENGSTEAFLGIPFAQPPLGSLRWSSTKPWIFKKETYHANNFQPACMQGPHLTNWYKDVISSFGGNSDLFLTPDTSEDCLYLNIWRPAQTLDLLPVIVFIHGGSNKGGWSYEPNYIGQNLSQKGVLVVTIAYRLGVFGFFSHPELKHSNYGLLDQIEALKWVKNNIKNFGGDDSNITIMGESAGANNIEYLLTSSLSQGIFTKAIHQSGGSSLNQRSSKYKNLERSASLTRVLIGEVKINQIEKLRQITPEEILFATESIYEGHYFEPVIDGHSVKESIIESLKKNTSYAVDLLIGHNNDEWLMYLDNEIDIDSWLFREFNNNISHNLKAFLSNIPNKKRQLDLLITAKNYVCPSFTLASELNKKTNNIWFYSFNRTREGAKAKSMGAYHGAELPYVFNTHDDWLPTNNADQILTDTIQSYWTQFAKTGNPNGNGKYVWYPFTKTNPVTQILDVQVKSSVHSSVVICDEFVREKSIN